MKKNLALAWLVVVGMGILYAAILGSSLAIIAMATGAAILTGYCIELVTRKD